MKFFKKLRDVNPGDVIVEAPMEADPGAAHDIWSALLPMIDIPENAWSVDVEVKIRVGVIVPPEGDAG